MPSSQYIKYEKSCLPYLIGKKAIGKPPFNLKAVFYMQTKRKVDLSNLLGAICDILVKYKVIEDDNCNVLSSFDGSKVLYDKENPRTEIYIQTLGWQK
jgi:Holliday junction resolvase RusA-like endonuclease